MACTDSTYVEDRHEQQSSFPSQPVFPVAPCSPSMEQPTGHVVSSSDGSPSHPPSDNCRTPTWFLRSFMRWAWKPSRADQGLPLYVAGEVDQDSSSSSTPASSRTSTLVDESVRGSTRFSLGIRIPVPGWTFLSCWTVQKPIPRHDYATTV